MRQRNFHFELRDNTLALANALNDVVIKRFKDNSRKEIEKELDVRFVYGQKHRVLHDIINAAKATTLPVIALDLKSFSHDTSRIFNKNSEFYDNAISSGECSRYLTPTPIKLSYGITIITRYRTDLEQIISNFIPHFNPYIIISLHVPDEFKLHYTQEIRSKVLWDGSFNIEYPDPINSTQKQLFTATTNFTVDGWLFKPEEPPAKPIYSIDANFIDNLIEDNDFGDLIHVDAYPIIKYVCLNGKPQTTINPDFIYGETSIKDYYIPKLNFNINQSNNKNCLSLIGNGLTHNNKFILDGSMYNLNKIGEYKKFDLSYISTNKTPISRIKKGLTGINITNNVEIINAGCVQYIIPDILDVGEYTITSYNNAGISNIVTFTIVSDQ